MAIKMDGHTITQLVLHASNGDTVTKELTEEGGTGPSGTITITENGSHDVEEYAAANVQVPNTYTAGDEGKVVSDGALVEQSSATYTSNGTYDTTLKDEVIIDVSSAEFTSLIERTNTSILNSAATAIGDSAFLKMGTLTSVNLPNATIAYASAFSGCWALTSINLPKLATLNGGNIFEGVAAQTIVLPALISSGTGSYIFRNNTHLQAVDLYFPDKIGQQWFAGDTALSTIIIRNASYVPALGGTNAFNNTPFASGGTGGTIYIPEALYNHLGDGTSLDYKAASNWSTVDGYGTITWAKIEGSTYETHYADGSVIS